MIHSYLSIIVSLYTLHHIYDEISHYISNTLQCYTYLYIYLFNKKKYFFLYIDFFFLYIFYIYFFFIHYIYFHILHINFLSFSPHTYIYFIISYFIMYISFFLVFHLGNVKYNYISYTIYANCLKELYKLLQPCKTLQRRYLFCLAQHL